MDRKAMLKAVRKMKAEGKSRDDARAWLQGESGYVNPKTSKPLGDAGAYLVIRRIYGHAYGKRPGTPTKTRRYKHTTGKADPRTSSGFKSLVKAIGQLELVESDKLALIQLVAEL